MIYFKHPELSEKYHVSLKTIHNWIDAAKQGKVNLKLHSVNNRTYIANTPENSLILNDLSTKGKKYRNTLHHKIIEPKAEFFEIFNRRQILDIVTNLNVYKELPKQYDYLNQGAANWDNWIKRLTKEDGVTNLSGTVELLHENMGAIDRLLGDVKRINIVDLGVGNAYPVKELLEHLHQRGTLHRYIAIDISKSMLDIAEKHTKEWFGEDFPYEGHVRDMTFERFDDLLVDDMLGASAEETINLVLVLGSTPVNFRSFISAFKTAHDSMGKKDFLIQTMKPDSEESRQYFDFATKSGTTHLSQNDQNGYFLNLLNIDSDLYEVERGYAKDQRMRYIRIRLKSSFTIKFSFNNINRKVNLEKGDTILLHRMWHLTPAEIISEFEQVGLTLLQSSMTYDRQYFLSISGVETKENSKVES